MADDKKQGQQQGQGAERQESPVDAKNAERAARAAEETGVTEKFLGPGATGDPNNPGELGDAPASPPVAALGDDVARAADGTPLTSEQAEQTGAGEGKLDNLGEDNQDNAGKS